MADFEIDAESKRRAASLSSRLVDNARREIDQGPRSDIQYAFPDSAYAEEAADTPLRDVTSHMRAFVAECTIQLGFDGRVLCTDLEEMGLVPVSLRESATSPLPPADEFRRAHPEQDEILVDVDMALDSVERGLSKFLSHRVAAIKRWPMWNAVFGSSGGPTAVDLAPGVGATADGAPLGTLPVHVSCRTPGLRIHIAPAFFLNWVYFGSPSTPVSSYVMPGLWVFAADGPALAGRRRDTGVFSIPPTSHLALKKF
jgi:hypothetical protein